MAGAEQKAAEILIEKLITGIVDTVVKEWNYIYKFKEYVGIVETNALRLRGLEVDVQQAVNVAKWGGKVTGGDDKRWIADANKSNSESIKILEEANKVKNGSWKQRVNVFRRFCLSRKAASLAATMTTLIDQAEPYAKANHGVTPTGMLPAVKPLNHDELESRKLLLDKVMEALKKDENYMIGICGIAGVGKTTLADEVKRIVLEEKLFDAAVKVVMSKDLKIHEIQGVIASNLGMKPEGPDDEDAIARRLQKRLMEGTNLVILDNVWDEVPVHRIGLPLYGMHGCKVLVTSRNHLMLRTMAANQNFEVTPLVHSEARHLFKKVACTIPDEKILDKLTEKCGGLPLAINTIASRLVNRDIQVWKNALHEVEKSIASNESTSEDHVYTSIKVSYNLLKSKTDAQRLLLLCCLFPEEEDIPIQKLVRYVKGLQLLHVSDSLVDTSCYVFTLLDELINCSLLLHGDRDTTVKINHVVRSVCLSISLNEEKNRLNVKHTPKLRTWPYDKEEQQSYTGISLTFSDQMESLDLPDGLVYPDLELLQLQFHGDSLNLSENTFKGMTLVRVLDFKRMTLWGKCIRISALIPVLNILTNLRTLCIEFCDLRGVDLKLIQSHKCLEVLSFFCSKDVTLPAEIKELTNLKLLDLRCDGQLIIPSKVLPKLKMLEELYLGNYFKWSDPADVQNGTATADSICITELSQLPLLRVLQVCVRKPTLLLKLEEEAWFEGLTKFQIVGKRASQKFRDYEIGKSITLYYVEWYDLLKAKIHKLLKITECLTLEATAFRNIFVEFSGLENLELKNCDVKYIMDAEDSAETLNKLNHLKIGHMKNLKALCEKDLPKKSLVKLETIKLENLKLLKYLWTAQPDSGCLGKLRVLDMSRCEAITSIFPLTVAKGLVQLERLDITNCEVLKWIVSKEEDGKPVEKIVFNKLTHLSLNGLPNFCSFFPDSFVVKTSAKGTSEKAAKDDQKSNCSNWFALKRHASHTGGLSASKDKPLPTSNVNQDQQVPKHDVQKKKSEPLFNQLVQLSSMKKLLIGSINNIEHVVDDDTSTETIKEIKMMVVTNCNNLLSVAASEDSIRSLRDLEQVKVESCESMKALFNLGTGSDAKTSTDVILDKLASITLQKLDMLNQVLPKFPEKTSSFANLKSLEISECGSLKYIFSVSIAKKLGRLEDLKVSDCANVEEIIESDKEEKTDTINFSCIRVLHLDNLTSMSSFSSSGTREFNFPKLKDMLVRKCPSMLTFCKAPVRARLLYDVKAGDLPDQRVPNEDALNETIVKLHQLNYHRGIQRPTEIEVV